MRRIMQIAGVAALVVGVTPAQAQERVYHPFHVPAGHNWTFRAEYPAADRLFNAFDYGHGILYETLWSRPDAPVSLLEEEIFHRLTREILLNPPRLPMPEASFMPRYARLVPRAKEMFEWAHILHRQSYDVLADRSLSRAEQDRAMAELLRVYRSSDLAFPVEPKGMEIMDDQYFSKVFRERYPRFNGLIWAYHWLQVAIYEPLLVHDTPEERQAAIHGTLLRFWQMVEGAPETLPSEMPMTPAIAPVFTERYPEFAAIFDNLHMMHDVISDILVSEAVARGDKRREIYRQTDLFRDPSAMATSVEAWIAMALAHGVDAQGGPATGWLPEAPTRGAAGHDPPGGHGGADAPDPHAGHEPAPAAPAPAAPEHAGHHAEHHPVPAGDHAGHGAGEGHAGPGQQEAAREVVRSFHRALSTGDSLGALALLHPEVQVLERGAAESFQEYREHHLAADIRASMALTRHILHEELVHHEGTVIYTARTHTMGRIGDRDVDSNGVETMVLVHTPDGWRIRHIHWSSR
jgi:ketosteroid isomerase-like protein